MRCLYCDKGVIHRLINSAGFHFNAEEPIEEDEACEECGGTGELPDAPGNAQQQVQADSATPNSLT